MTAVIACVSQKGGVAKSSLARLITREYAALGKTALLADLDTLQSTSVEWAKRRFAAQMTPLVPAQSFETVKRALKIGQDYQYLVLDGRGFADPQTMEAASAARAIILPTGLAVDDLRPSVRLGHELTAAGLKPSRMLFALCRTGDSDREIAEARQYIQAAGYRCLAIGLSERTGYRQAHDEGRTVTEARHPALRAKARHFADELIGTLNDMLMEKKK